MCRLTALFSDETFHLGDIVTRPPYSIIRQSFASREREWNGPNPSEAYKQASLNGDGYGIGWYEGNSPCTVVAAKPAWNCPNLSNLSEHIKSHCFVAHVRAAAPDTPISDLTCHPFHYNRLLFMHNGLIGDFSAVRRELLNTLSDELYNYTLKHAAIDSVCIFALLLNSLNFDRIDDPKYVLYKLNELVNHQLIPVTTGSLGNFVISHPDYLIATRYSWGGLVPASLYYSYGSNWNSKCQMEYVTSSNLKPRVFIVSSEPLNAIVDDWTPLTPSTAVICHKMRILKYNLSECNILHSPNLTCAKDIPNSLSNSKFYDPLIQVKCIDNTIHVFNSHENYSYSHGKQVFDILTFNHKGTSYVFSTSRLEIRILKVPEKLPHKDRKSSADFPSVDSNIICLKLDPSHGIIYSLDIVNDILIFSSETGSLQYFDLNIGLSLFFSDSFCGRSKRGIKFIRLVCDKIKSSSSRRHCICPILKSIDGVHNGYIYLVKTLSDNCDIMSIGSDGLIAQSEISSQPHVIAKFHTINNNEIWNTTSFS